jgi:integration host factor subunit beta
VLKEGDEVSAVVTNIDRKTRNIQLSIRQKDMADEQGAMAQLSQQSAREQAGTTSLGALLRAKLNDQDRSETERARVARATLVLLMTRSDLVEELASRFSQLTHRDAEYAVKTILDAMSEALVRGHRIEIRGFGSFSINRRPPRMGRNPRSGESVHIPEKRVPHFKPGKALREAVDQRTKEMESGR